MSAYYVKQNVPTRLRLLICIVGCVFASVFLYVKLTAIGINMGMALVLEHFCFLCQIEVLKAKKNTVGAQTSQGVLSSGLGVLGHPQRDIKLHPCWGQYGKGYHDMTMIMLP